MDKIRNLRILHKGDVHNGKSHWFFKLYPDNTVLGELTGLDNNAMVTQQIPSSLPLETAEDLVKTPIDFAEGISST